MKAALLIADRNQAIRKQMAKLFSQAGYKVSSTGSAVAALVNVVTRRPQVVVLGVDFDDLAADVLIPLLKTFNKDLTIILLSDEPSLSFLRKVRREGIFYHALTPVNDEDWKEIEQVVACAFETARNNEHEKDIGPEHATI